MVCHWYSLPLSGDIFGTQKLYSVEGIPVNVIQPLDNIDNRIFESEIELLMIKYLLGVEGNMVPGMSRKNKFLNPFFRARNHLLLVRHPAEGTPNKRRRGYSPS